MQSTDIVLTSGECSHTEMALTITLREKEPNEMKLMSKGNIIEHGHKTTTIQKYNTERLDKRCGFKIQKKTCM